MNDLRVRATVCQCLEMRVMELSKEKGNNLMLGLFRTIILQSKEIAHSRIKSWNDGIYCASAFQDHVGTEESLSMCHVTMRKQDDHITFDFRGGCQSTMQVPTLMCLMQNKLGRCEKIATFPYLLKEEKKN